jgi:hypothetical protein
MESGPLEPVYSPEASKQLDRLEGDPSQGALWDAVADAIDLICDAPTSADARREALRTLNGQTVWKVPVRCRIPDEDWVVLWQPRGGDALIAYIGPL